VNFILFLSLNISNASFVVYYSALSLEVAKSIQAEYLNSEVIRSHDQGIETDAKGVNTTSMNASLHLTCFIPSPTHFCKNSMRVTLPHLFHKESESLSIHVSGSTSFDFISANQFLRGTLILP